MSRLIYGVGVNDSSTPVYTYDTGRQVKCRYYQVWTGMLERAFSSKFQEKNPTYVGTTVHNDWLSFSKFKEWMITQDWEGNDLDKDLLVKGNQHYCPEMCMFIPHEVNVFLTSGKNNGLPKGVSIQKSSGRYIAQCSQFNGKNTYIGIFDTPEDAHRAWLKRKRQLAIEIAKKQTDVRISDALLSYF